MVVFPAARRLLLKISGQFFQGALTHGVCWPTLHRLARHLVLLSEYQWVIVVGGGNFFRGRDSKGHAHGVTADAMGMLATCLNGLALSEVLQQHGLKTQLFSARAIDGIAASFHGHQALSCLESGHVVVCVAGVGHGGVTTDTAAVVRACELDCQLILKGTQVAGVYGDDPKLNPQAPFYPSITYGQSIQQRLGIMDLAAMSLAWQAQKPTLVFSITSPEGLLGVMRQEIPFTLMTPGE